MTNMRRIQLIICELCLVIVVIQMFNSVSSNGQEELKEAEWLGRLEDGTVINESGLSVILSKHEKWV